MVTNLLANARKYTPAGTTVTVSAHPGGFAVHDDGPGFPDDLVDHAFERFARGDVARTRAGERAAATASASRWSPRSSPPTAAPCALHSVPGDTTVSVELPAAG